MKFDRTLLTGLFLGITVGLWYMNTLAAYLPFFVLASVIFLVSYIHGK